MSGKGDWKTWHMKCLELEKQIKTSHESEAKMFANLTIAQGRLAAAEGLLDEIGKRVKAGDPMHGFCPDEPCSLCDWLLKLDEWRRG